MPLVTTVALNVTTHPSLDTTCQSILKLGMSHMLDYSALPVSKFAQPENLTEDTWQDINRAWISMMCHTRIGLLRIYLSLGLLNFSLWQVLIMISKF